MPKKLPSGNGTTLGAPYIINSASKMKKQMHHNSTEHNHKLTWIVHNWVRNKRREKKKNNDAGKQRSRIESSHGHRPRHSETPHSTFLSPLSSSSNLISVLSLFLSHNCLINFIEFQLILLVSIQLLSVFQSARRRRSSSLRITWIRFFSLRSPPRSVA